MHFEFKDISIPIGGALAVLAAIFKFTTKTSSKVTFEYAETLSRLKRCEENINKLGEKHRKHIENQEAKENEISTQINNLGIVMTRIETKLDMVERTIGDMKKDIKRQ